MGYFRGYESGHSRGGVDVTEAVNLAFKGILLSPIFILCIFITIAMLKHMIFGGIPTMNQPTEQQRETLRERDENINPTEVWGGSNQTESVPVLPKEETNQVPFRVYDTPGYHTDSPKYGEVLPPAEWNTEILSDPFS